MRRIFISLATLLAGLILISGCSSLRNSFSQAADIKPDNDIAATQHNPVSLMNYKAAREFSAQGRYELAKEHYLLAYAAAEDDSALRDVLHNELTSIDLMIRTLR